jgi:hypothetical protein
MEYSNDKGISADYADFRRFFFIFINALHLYGTEK